MQTLSAAGCIVTMEAPDTSSTSTCSSLLTSLDPDEYDNKWSLMLELFVISTLTHSWSHTLRKLFLGGSVGSPSVAVISQAALSTRHVSQVVLRRFLVCILRSSGVRPFLSVDPNFGKIFKVGCTFSVSLLSLPTSFRL